MNIGRAREALPIQTKVLTAERRISGPDNPETLWCENVLAKVQDKAGDPASAAATYSDLLARARVAFSHGEWDFAAFEANAAKVESERGNIASARVLLADSVARFTAALGPEHARTKSAKAALEALK
jgi:hypothetical protein